MIIKGIALTALVASTPLALFATQDPVKQDPKPAVSRKAEQRSADAELRRTQANVKRARAELKAAQRDLARLRDQLNAALDRLDQHATPERERNCSPSRSRTLMSHYQWLRDQGHQQRAQGALSKVVEQVGDDAGRLNSVAWDLMTDKQTAGKFDELALALTQRMEQVAKTQKRRRGEVHYNHLDTAALANFLNGNVEKAISLQQLAIEKGGRSDDFRRRLRTYEAAQSALVKATQAKPLPAATMVASGNEEEEEE
ncbi:MAG: hypothetical protein KAI24_01735 [Planctomycetes bacterium]|nr:hypothetical protein [Planctomycetota bacterium]